MSTGNIKAQVICKALREDGVKPFWLGKDDEGKLYEYVTFPWVAGADVFVLVREPNQPTTVQCLEALQVLPEHCRATQSEV